MNGEEGRRPWWYSGGPEGDGAETAGSEAERIDEPGAGHDDENSTNADGESAAGMDWTLLVAGAQRMVDWATERVMAPHAEHGDPAEHPQCVVCRTIVLVGDAGGMGVPGPDDDVAESNGGPAPIVWIPIREDAGRPSIGD